MLNSLYVTTNGTYLSRQRETLVAKCDGRVLLQIPISTLENVTCFGNVMASPPLIGLCCEQGVGLAFLSEHGRFIARIEGSASGSSILRTAQYRGADDPKTCNEISRAIIGAKISNCRKVLQRASRKETSSPALGIADGRLRRLVAKTGKVDNLDSLRGLEGEAASIYFGVFNHLLSADSGFNFATRSRRPPMDPINALLSFFYVLLTNEIASALSAVGLDPGVGFLHKLRSGRHSLALDIVEEFRAMFADRLALRLVNRRQLSTKDFKTTASGACQMSDAARKTVLEAYQKRKQEGLVHPFLQERISLGQFFHVQARLMAKFLRGDLDAYPPVYWT